METSLSSYDFHLPERLIAQAPADPRDSGRLLVVDRAARTIDHRRFLDLPGYLDSRDLLVANNTRVLKARLLGARLREENGREVEGGKVEFVMLEEQAPRVWEGLFHASAKYNPGLKFLIPTPDGRGLRGVIVRGVKESAHGTIVVEFDRDPIESGAGELPLPHYIQRPPGSSDDSAYQTVYAKAPGSAAAPTAGLHFTDRVLREIRERGADWDEVTLHVGLGTFRPVKTEDITQHRMHEERYEVSEGSAARISAARRAGRRILAVGTTSVRTLESAWDVSLPGGGALRSGMGRTSLFIRPGAYRFQVVDRMLTNFHLPKSTLLMLVCAFGGRDLILEAYRQAVEKEYRFFSYGDAMLIL